MMWFTRKKDLSDVFMVSARSWFPGTSGFYRKPAKQLTLQTHCQWTHCPISPAWHWGLPGINEGQTVINSNTNTKQSSHRQTGLAALTPQANLPLCFLCIPAPKHLLQAQYGSLQGIISSGQEKSPPSDVFHYFDTVYLRTQPVKRWGDHRLPQPERMGNTNSSTHGSSRLYCYKYFDRQKRDRMYTSKPELNIHAHNTD